MGSIRYARYCHEKKDAIQLVICLDMVGFYSDEKIQKFPQYPGAPTYAPQEANFVILVSEENYATITQRFFRYLQQHNRFPTQILVTPSSVKGINLSDHASFWKYGYPGLMISDTAFYRTPYYHTPADTANTLDYKKMAMLAQGLAQAIQELDKED
jgi:hypothetical protein